MTDSPGGPVVRGAGLPVYRLPVYPDPATALAMAVAI
jgi:hypothetical protein